MWRLLRLRVSPGEDEAKVVVWEEPPEVEDSFELLLAWNEAIVAPAVASEGLVGRLKPGTNGLLRAGVGPGGLSTCILVLMSSRARRSVSSGVYRVGREAGCAAPFAAPVVGDGGGRACSLARRVRVEAWGLSRRREG